MRVEIGWVLRNKLLAQSINCSLTIFLEFRSILLGVEKRIICESRLIVHPIVSICCKNFTIISILPKIVLRILIISKKRSRRIRRIQVRFLFFYLMTAY